MPRVVISAGEPSGDYLGACLINELLRNGVAKDEIDIIGGTQMENALGRQSIFPVRDISVMGYIEVISKIPTVMMRIRQATTAIAKFKPDIVLTIDSGGFHFRLVAALRKKLFNTKFYHYVSPSIWAYRYSRIFKIKKLYDGQFVLYKFEKAFYDKEEVPCVFVGHPLTERTFPKYIGCDREEGRNIISIFCGSRELEVRTLAPIFLDALQEVNHRLGEKFTPFIATLPHLEPILRDIVRGYDFKCIISSEAKDKEYFIPRSRLALSKSGTITLELMFYNIPIIVAHKINPITAFFLKKVLRIKHVSLGNIIAQREIIPELLQEKCNKQCIAEAILNILRNGSSVSTAEYPQVLVELNNGTGKSPSELICSIMLGKGKW